MTNVISFQFDLYPEFHYHTIFLNTFKHALNEDTIKCIYGFLLPPNIDFTRPIRVYYEEKNHASWEYNTRYVVLNYYDFIFQTSRHVWSNVKFKSHDLFPCYRHHNFSYRCNHMRQIIYPVHFNVIQNNPILWVKLFLELACDFHKTERYFCTFYQSESSLKRQLNRKYTTWSKNNIV